MRVAPAVRRTRPPGRSGYALRGVALVVAVQAVVLIATAGRYGPHRDELYFASAGDRLAWGYPDQPSLTPLLAHISQLVAPGNLVVARLWSVLAVAVVVALAAEFARLLGGSAPGQVLAAGTVAGSAIVLGLGHLLSTATFDLLAWTAILVLVARSLVDDRPRLWLYAGLVAGVGLENKHSVVFCLLGVLVGVAVVRETRPVLRTRWPWLGGLLALLMWLPNLIWQGANDWPVFILAADIADEYGGLAGRIDLVTEALLMFSPVIGVVWILGLVKLLRRDDWRRARPVGVAFLVILLTFLVVGGKGYYLAGAIVPLVAAGCVALAERWPGRRTVMAGVALVASAAVAWPAVFPVAPARLYAGSVWQAINDDQLDTIGWPEYAEQVRAVVEGLPADQRRTAVIFTSNYGEAGALEWYDVGLPVFSGHNGWRNWGPPPNGTGPVVVVYQDSPTRDFGGCAFKARLRNDVGADNEEVGAGVWVCAAPRGDWAVSWPRLSHYDA